MGIFGPIKKDKQDSRVRQPPDQIVKKLLRGPIDPVQILNSKNNRSVLTLSNEQVTKGLKGPHPFLLRLDLEIGCILDIER